MLPPVGDGDGERSEGGGDLDAARRELQSASAAAAAELGAIEDPAAKVVQALARLERCVGVAVAAEAWPGDVAG